MRVRIGTVHWETLLDWILTELAEPMQRGQLHDRALADFGAICQRRLDRAIAALVAEGRVVRLQASIPLFNHLARGGSVYTRNGFDPDWMGAGLAMERVARARRAA